MDWLLSVDHNIFLAINHFRNGFFDLFFYTISLLGEYGIIWILIAILALIIDKKNGKKFFYLSLIALALTLLIDDFIIKSFFYRTRPYLALENVYQLGKRWQNSSFPSGHASSSFASITLIYFYYRKYFIWAVIFGLLTLYGRLYLGMHYLSDVIAGTLVGLSCGWLTIYIYNKIYNPKISLTKKIFDHYHR